MKLRFSLLGLASLALLTACPPAPKPVANGWVMDFRGGTINLDSSAASGAARDASYRASLQKTLERFTGLRVRLPTEVKAGAEAKTSIATGVSFYVALKQNGGLPTENATLEFQGPQKVYSYVDQNNQPTKPVYGSGNSWFYSQIQTSQGSGLYRAQATVSAGIVSAETNINTSDVLNPPNLFEVGASPDGTLAADWNAIPNAKSYLAIVYDRTARQTVWAGVGKGSTLEIFSGLTVNPNNSYDLTISAFNFEINDSPKAPALTGLEANVNSVIFARQFSIGTPNIRIERNGQQLLESSPVQLTSTGAPNGEAVGAVKLFSTNISSSALRYEIELPDNSGVTFSQGLRGILRYNTSRNIEAKAPCSADESDKTVVGQLKTNAINTPNRPLLVQVECVRTITGATQVWQKQPGMNSLNYLALSPQGTKLVAAGYDGLRVWDVATGEIAFVAPLFMTQSANGVAWKPDGTQLAYLTSSELTVLNAVTFEQVFKINVGFASAMKWSPDGSKILVVSYNGAKLFNATTGAEILTFSSWTSGVSKFDWSPNGNQVAASIYDGMGNNTVTIWNASTGAVARRIDADNFLRGLAWSADSSQVATGYKNQIRIWDVATGQEQTGLTFPTQNFEFVFLQAWDKTNQRFIMDFGGKTRTVNATTGAFIQEFTTSTLDIVSPIDRLATRINTTNNTLQIKVYNLETAQETATINSQAQQISKIIWHPDNNSFAVLAGATAQIFNKAGVLLRELPYKTGFFWSRDGSQYATSDGSTLQLRDSTMGNVLLPIPLSAAANQVFWNENSSLIAVQENLRVRVINTTTGTEVWRLEDGRNIGVNPDGTKIVILVGQSFNNIDLRVYNFVSGALEKNVNTSGSNMIFSVNWGADPNRFVAFGGAAGGLAWVFDLQTNANYQINSGNRNIANYQWSGNGRRIFVQFGNFSTANSSLSVASSVSGDVGSNLVDLSGNTFVAPQFSVSPDGTTLVTSYNNSGLRLYSLTYSP